MGALGVWKVGAGQRVGVAQRVGTAWKVGIVLVPLTLYTYISDLYIWTKHDNAKIDYSSDSS
jgi:hypothetical protein